MSALPQVKPLLSLDKVEARHRVLSLYRAWYRHVPSMVNDYVLPVSVATAHKTLRNKFEEHKHVKDIRVIDMLVIKVGCLAQGHKSNCQGEQG